MAKNELTLEELAKQIYKGAGGMGNVESIVHSCAYEDHQ